MPHAFAFIFGPHAWYVPHACIREYALIESSPAAIETPPARASSEATLSPSPLPKATSASGSSSDLPMTSSQTSVANSLLSKTDQQGLEKEIAEAKGKVKDDKKAAKDAVKMLKQNFAQPGVAAKAAMRPGRGRGGRGRGRGKKVEETEEGDMTVEDVEDMEDEEAEEIESMSSATTLAL